MCQRSILVFFSHCEAAGILKSVLILSGVWWSFLEAAFHGLAFSPHRAYHSDVTEMPFASVQDLNSSDRKYAYVVWKLSDDGERLSLRNVSNKVVPRETRDSAMVAALLTKNARNPELFGEEIEFRKEK
jgi:hypothetical protein